MTKRSDESRLAWGQWDFEAWETDPGLALCSMAAQGFWKRLLCIAWKADGYVLISGKVPTTEELAFITRQKSEDVELWISELEARGVFSRANFRGVAGAIYSRRMVRDLKMRAINRENGKRGGNPSLLKDRGNPKPVKAEKEKEIEKESSRANPHNGNGSDPVEIPADIRRIEPAGKRAWAAALRFLELRTELSNNAARSFIAKMQRDFSLADEELFEVAEAAWRANPSDPRPYFLATARSVVERRRGGGEADVEVQRAWLREFRERAASWRGERGPRPGSPGCRIAPEVLEEFGFEVSK